jgi:hypothetical protein
MKLFIQIEDGNCINHPAFEDNLIQAFGDVPPNWEPFIRIPRPNIGPYRTLESQEPTYQKIDGVWQDVWALSEMTEEEKIAKQNKYKEEWAALGAAGNLLEGWDTWQFDETLCLYIPPKESI